MEKNNNKENLIIIYFCEVTKNNKIMHCQKVIKQMFQKDKP